MNTEETARSSISTKPVDVRDEDYDNMSDTLILYEDQTCKITKAGITLKVRKYACM